VFLLGASASVKAGVPDTFRFVKEFQRNITNPGERYTINKIIKTLRDWQHSDIDVELLLETLTKLDTREQEPLLKFFRGGEFVLSGYSEKRPIVEGLKDFIKRKAIIESPEKIRYFEPLLGFIEEHTPLDIFSVNYDTCIEQFCNVYKLNYQDGFDVNWNPQVFERENIDIRLYKLHGSIIWYRSDRSGYIKLPVMIEKAGIQLITGEKAESLMLYPMQKFDYAEPLLHRIYATMDPHPAFRVVRFLTRFSRGRGRLDTEINDPFAALSSDSPRIVLSSSQMNALAAAIFLAFNIGVKSLPLQAAMLDDPLQSLDDVNLLGLIDLLRRVRDQRQLIVSTHDARFGRLLERKLRPVQDGQRTIMIEFKGWSRQGPDVEVREVARDPKPLRIVAHA